MTRRRRPWLAALANLLAAPLGHVYAGRPGRGVLVYCAGVVIGTSALFAGQYAAWPALFLVLLALPACVYPALATDAYRIARRAGADYELKRFNRWYVYVAVVIALWAASEALASLIRRDLIQAFKTPSGAMIPTLLIGDHVLVNKRVYRVAEPRRFEVVVFEYPQDATMTFVKRIVGLPGDSIEIKDTVAWVNGAPVQEPYAAFVGGEEGDGGAGRDFGPVRVPLGQYFVLGDNRDASSDSRTWGFVPREKVAGRVQVIYWSWDHTKGSVRWDRIGRAVE